jgi:replication factor A1
MLTYNFVLLTPCFCCRCSGASPKVVLWGERATSFPTEETHKISQTSPYIVIFVGMLLKSYGVLSLTGSSSCKWYMNPQVKEAKQLMVR